LHRYNEAVVRHAKELAEEWENAVKERERELAFMHDKLREFDQLQGPGSQGDAANEEAEREEDASAAAAEGGGIFSFLDGLYSEEDEGGGGAEDEDIDLEQEFADALASPMFNEDCKKTFLEAQARLEAKEAPMKAQIDSEVRKEYSSLF
jgi:hypothetical protein